MTKWKYDAVKGIKLLEAKPEAQTQAQAKAIQQTESPSATTVTPPVTSPMTPPTTPPATVKIERKPKHTAVLVKLDGVTTPHFVTFEGKWMEQTELFGSKTIVYTTEERLQRAIGVDKFQEVAPTMLKEPDVVWQLPADLIQGWGQYLLDAFPTTEVAILYGRKVLADGSVQWLGVVPEQEVSSASVDIDDYAKAMDRLIGGGYRVIGTLHTHPGGLLTPSCTDTDDLWQLGGVHLIVSRSRGISWWFSQHEAYWRIWEDVSPTTVAVAMAQTTGTSTRPVTLHKKQLTEKDCPVWFTRKERKAWKKQLRESTFKTKTTTTITTAATEPETDTGLVVPEFLVDEDGDVKFGEMVSEKTFGFNSGGHKNYNYNYSGMQEGFDWTKEVGSQVIVGASGCGYPAYCVHKIYDRTNTCKLSGYCKHQTKLATEAGAVNETARLGQSIGIPTVFPACTFEGWCKDQRLLGTEKDWCIYTGTCANQNHTHIYRKWDTTVIGEPKPRKNEEYKAPYTIEGSKVYGRTVSAEEWNTYGAWRQVMAEKMKSGEIKSSPDHPVDLSFDGWKAIVAKKEAEKKIILADSGPTPTKAEIKKAEKDSVWQTLGKGEYKLVDLIDLFDTTDIRTKYFEEYNTIHYRLIAMLKGIRDHLQMTQKEFRDFAPEKVVDWGTRVEKLITRMLFVIDPSITATAAKKDNTKTDTEKGDAPCR